ncbi:MAG: DUF3857 domain-containing protein [Sphingomicrobium sp.]
MDRQPGRGPIPAWVKPVPIPAADPKRAEAPLQVLKLEGQTRFEKDGEATYFEMVVKPQTVAGLQGFSTIVLPWNVARTDLTVHAIEAIRDGTTIDLIKGQPFTILRRESKLEQSTMDGVRSVVLPVRGIEIGDTIRISATYRELHSDLASKPDDLSKWNAPFAIGSFERRVIVPSDVSVKWRVSGRAPKPTITQTAAGTEYRFSASSIEPGEFPKYMLSRDQADDVQFSGYQNWPEVAEAHVSLYLEARKLAPGSSLAKEADKIAAQSTDPYKRMMAALRLGQERVRYVAMLLGEGAYRPVGAEETWEARYGDCKAKSALLLALLDKLGIKAETMYVNSSTGDAIGDRLPSLETFDHVIVKATIDGKSYYLDATDYGHRVIGDVVGSDYDYGLPIAKGGTLEKLPPIMATEPTQDTELVWDGSKGLSGEVPFKARLTFRGALAIRARLKKASAEKVSDFEDYVKAYMPGIKDEKLTIVSQQDNADTGEYVVEFTGKDEMGWDEYEDRKGARYPFSNYASNWDVDFDRTDGPFKDARVVLNPAFWEREKETVILPTAKGFKIDDAHPIDRTIAGTHIWRTVVMEGNQVSSITNFRHLDQSIAAQDARAAVEGIKGINANWAYLVGPRSLKPKGD